MIGELGFEYCVRRFSKIINWPVAGNLFVSFLGYMVLGSLAGGLSLLLFPKLFIIRPDLQFLNLLIMPVGMGFMMTRYGFHLRRKGKKTIELDSFTFGYIFALSMSFVRYLFAR
jgi:hypothetical protein